MAASSSEFVFSSRSSNALEAPVKKQLRETHLANRARLTTPHIILLSGSILKKFWRLKCVRNLDKCLPEKRSVWMSCYVDFDHEVQTRTLLHKALGRGYRVAVPVVLPGSNAGIMLSEVSTVPGQEDPGPGWVRSSFGLMQPRDLKPVDPFEIDCFVVPGLAFDRFGFRLGFGKGYYDRLFEVVKSKIPRIGLAFSWQLVERLPREHWDVQMHRVVTEKKVVRCDLGLLSNHVHCSKR